MSWLYLTNQMFYKVSRSRIYILIASRPTLVKNNFLDYALKSILKENDLKSKKAVKNLNMKISNNNKIIKKSIKKKKKSFAFPSDFLNTPSKKEIHYLAKYLVGLLNQDNLFTFHWNNKRQSPMIQRK